MPGILIIVLVMVLLGPVAIMGAGAAWSALIGWTTAEDADARNEGQPV